jgi:hypothetical protein
VWKDGKASDDEEEEEEEEESLRKRSLETVKN